MIDYLGTPVRKGTPIQIRELETTYENSDRHWPQ